MVNARNGWLRAQDLNHCRRKMNSAPGRVSFYNDIREEGRGRGDLVKGSRPQESEKEERGRTVAGEG